MNEIRKRIFEIEQNSDSIATGFPAFLGKLGGIAGSIALILHTVENPQGGISRAVSAATVERADRCPLHRPSATWHWRSGVTSPPPIQWARFCQSAPNWSSSPAGRGITATAIPSTRDAFYDAIANCDFDVLHISCHSQSSHQSIEQASLILGDETEPGTARSRLIEVDTITVEAEAKLKSRQPLVFLNACETGRLGGVLTDWGGWPNVFLRAGASAFVGTSWAVRDKPAAAFATAFTTLCLTVSLSPPPQMRRGCQPRNLTMRPGLPSRFMDIPALIAKRE